MHTKQINPFFIYLFSSAVSMFFLKIVKINFPVVHLVVHFSLKNTSILDDQPKPVNMPFQILYQKAFLIHMLAFQFDPCSTSSHRLFIVFPHFSNNRGITCNNEIMFFQDSNLSRRMSLSFGASDKNCSPNSSTRMDLNIVTVCWFSSAFSSCRETLTSTIAFFDRSFHLHVAQVTTTAPAGTESFFLHCLLLQVG